MWLGASCVLALLGTALFSQIVIAHRYEEGTHPSDSSTVLIAQAYEDWSPGLSGSTLGDQGLSATMVSYGTAGLAFSSNILNGMASASDNISINGLSSCDLANCSYGLHSTLNICAKCADISNEVNTESGRFVLRSNALSLDLAHGFINITSDTHYPDRGQLSASNIGPLIVRYLALGHDNDVAEKPPVATECVAYWCVTTFDAWMQNNVFYVAPGNDRNTDFWDLNANSTSNYSVSGRTYLGQDHGIYVNTDTCYVNNTKLAGIENCTFRVKPEAQLGLQNFLSEGYMGSSPLLHGSDEMASSRDAWRTTSFAASTIGSACTAGDDEIACTAHLNASLSESFTNMTTYMSNVIRKFGSRGVQYSYGTTSQTYLAFHIR